MKEPSTSEIAELKKKLEESPEPSTFVSLADAYRKEGSLDDARKVCLQGLEKHPGHWNAHFVLGRVYQDQSKSQEAVHEFKKVLELDPENHMAHSFLATLYMKLEDFKAAIDEYQAVMTINPDDDEAQEMLKTAIEKAALVSSKPVTTVKEAPAAKEASAPKKNDSMASLTMAELYLKQGHPDKAIEVYEEILGKDPDNETARQKVVELKSNVAINSLGSSAGAKTAVPKPAVKEEPKKTVADRKQDSKFTDDDIMSFMGAKTQTPAAKIPTEVAKTEVKVVETPKAESSPSASSGSHSPAQVEVLKGTLAELAAINGIRRCFLTSLEGINVVSVGESGNNEALEKQVLTIFKDTNQSAAKLEQGTLRQVLVTAETGHILLVSFAGGVLVVLADHQINLGMLRLAMDNAAKKLEKIK